MSRRRHFFATVADLQPGLERFESAFPVRFVQTGLFDSRAVKEFVWKDLPNLGTAPSGDNNHERAFLVMSRSIDIIVREVPQLAGEIKFAVDQLNNPDSTVFQSAGLYKKGVLTAGQIATTGATSAATPSGQTSTAAVYIDSKNSPVAATTH